MILNANSRGHGQELERHLLNVEDNEHAVVHELRGFVGDDLGDAFAEVEAIATGTKCQQYLFSLSLNPPKLETVPIETFEATIDAIEREQGLTGQPRAIVFHEKLGRRHAHCVWSRIDAEQRKGINLPHFKRKLTAIPDLSIKSTVGTCLLVCKMRRSVTRLTTPMLKPAKRNAQNVTPRN